MKVYEIRFILSLRNVVYSSTDKKSKLVKLLGDVNQEEMKKLKEFNAAITKDDPFPNYSPAEIKRSLESLSKTTIPLLLSALGSNPKGKILAYCKVFSIPTTIPQKCFTDEQESLLEDYTGIKTVNAGPGTGKTTVANERAFRLFKRGEGVLLISYTNEAITENYERMFIYPMEKSLGKKNIKKQVNVTTVDSLAFSITGHEEFDNHDQCIKAAIKKIETSDRIFPMYEKGKLKFQHIIVDEAQDIDENRGRLILSLYEKLNMKSLTLFGDPRQRLDNKKGKWYTHFCEKDDVVKLTYSHRFKNQPLLNLCNTISSKRPSIDHQLVNANKAENEGKEKSPIKFASSNAIINFILDEIDSGLQYSDFAVVGPSMDKQNISSRAMKKLVVIFKEQGIPCYTRKDGAFCPNAVLFSTIHSVKGKEFEYVISVGISDYHNRYNMIPRPDMDSLIYVLHTRAKTRMFYLQDDNAFSPPRYVPREMVENAPHSSGKLMKQYDFKPISVFDCAISHDWASFTSCNKILIEEVNLEDIKSTISTAPKGFNVALWGTLVGLMINICATKEYPISVMKYLNNEVTVLSDKKYRKLVREGKIYRGRFVRDGKFCVRKGDVNVPRENEVNMVRLAVRKDIPDLTNEDVLAITRIYDYINSETMLSRYDSSSDFGYHLISKCLKVAEEIINMYGDVKAEVKVSGLGYIGYLDLISKSTIIEIKTGKYKKEHGWQVMLYKQLLDIERDTIVINVCSGESVKITTKIMNEKWQYFLKCFSCISEHSFITNQRLNIKNLVQQEMEDNVYLVDTEFAPGEEIFEVALVNYNDVFKTVCQTINIENSQFASGWSNLSQEVFKESPRINDVVSLFDEVKVNDESPELLYYVCKTDYTWYKDCDAINLGPLSRQYSKKMGYFTGGYQPPKLGELYDLCSGSLLCFQEHLTPHTALSDALMLWEMVKLGLLQI